MTEVKLSFYEGYCENPPSFVVEFKHPNTGKMVMETAAEMFDGDYAKTFAEVEDFMGQMGVAFDEIGHFLHITICEKIEQMVVDGLLESV